MGRNETMQTARPTPYRTVVSRRLTDHRERMKVRRAEQHARVSGFTPIANKRFDAAIATQTLLLQLGENAVSAGEAQERAFHIVAKTLPHAPMFVRRLRAPRPSRNDDPAYRKALRPEPVAAAPKKARKSRAKVKGAVGG